MQLFSIVHIRAQPLLKTARECLPLSEGVTRQGCCINVIHDFYKSRNTFDPLEEVYSDCNVTLPGTGCNNGPLRNSSLLPGEPTRPPTRPPAGGDCLPQASFFCCTSVFSICHNYDLVICKLMYIHVHVYSCSIIICD